MQPYWEHYETIKIRCPYCREITDKIRRINFSITFGSPLRCCRYCGKTFFNKEYQECALYLFGYTGKTNPLVPIYTILLCACSVCYTIFMIWGLCHGRAGMVYALPAILLVSAFSWSCVKLTLEWIYGLLKPEALHRRMVDKIEGRNGGHTRELKESITRLSSREYLDTLRGCGVYVPEYFYQRLEEKPSLQMICSRSFPEPLSGKQTGPACLKLE